MIRPRRRFRRLVPHAVLLVGALAVTATLAGALHVREVRVQGCRRFPALEVEGVLRTALGTPTVAARPDELRAAVRALPWVADAHVSVSLDGIVSCTVVERTPVAVATDGGEAQLVDGEGRLLGTAPGPLPRLRLVGFVPFPEERRAILRAVPALEAAWGERLESAQRLGPADVALTFAGAPCVVLADPAAPEAVGSAREVLAAWLAAHGAPPRRLDARLPHRLAVLPAAPTPAEAPS